MPTNPPDVAILIALREEFRELHKLIDGPCKAVPNAKYGGDDYFFSVASSEGRPYRCVAFFMDAMTPVAAASASTRLLEYEPRQIVNLGLACSLDDKDLRLGDVIVASQVDGYDERAKAVDDGSERWVWKFGGEVYRTSAHLVHMVNQLEFSAPRQFDAWTWQGQDDLGRLRADLGAQAIEALGGLADARQIRTTPAVLKGHLASGVTVGAAAAFKRQLLDRDRNLKALEMEAAGVLRAACDLREPVDTLVLRGISDLGDSTKAAMDAIGDGALRGLAMRNAVRLLFATMGAGRLPQHEDDPPGRPQARTPDDGVRGEAGQHRPPVVMLAFADADPSSPLARLADEERAIRDALRPLQNDARLHVEPLWHATPDLIIDQLREPFLRGRVRVFHFGGHASGTELVFAKVGGGAEAAPAAPLAEYLGREGVSLVFLNGCETKEQMQRLRDAGVDAVVATSHAVRDDAAARFAKHFYAELSVRPLQQAFDAARNATEFTGEGATREIWAKPKADRPTDSWSWDIACADDDWRLVEPSLHFAPPSGPRPLPSGKGPGWQELVDELANVIHDPGEARNAALRAGFPSGSLPSFGMPSVFWSTVVREAENGRFAGGAQAIADEAARLYPSNSVFKRHRSARG